MNYRDGSRSGSLHALIEEQARLHPSRAAVRFEGRDLGYRELNERANRCAAYLRELGVGPDVPVGILMDRSFEMLIALVAVLKAGGAYLPLDPLYPEQRLLFLLQDADVTVLLTQSKWKQRATAFDGTRVELDVDADDYLRQRPATNPAANTSPSDLAYIIYTSGSTGKPKGCMISHEAIWNRLVWMQEEYQLTPEDRILQKTPYTFDVSVWELFWPLICGACVVMARPEGHKDNQYLVDLIVGDAITVCHFVPSMLRAFVGHADAGRCTGLRHVFCSGEALPWDLMQELRSLLPARLHNLYGPTEAAVDVTYWECTDRADGKVPIGRAISNVQLYVLDASLEEVPAETEGDLYIGGIALGRGYLNRPELTAECFIRSPFGPEGARLYRTGDRARVLADGNIEYLGRNNFQVKLRGLRIELGEIEATLREHEAIHEAAVLVRDKESGDPRLVAYVAMPDDSVDTATIRRFVGEQLPDYMVPNVVVRMAVLPVTAHGKLDRDALPWPPPRNTVGRAARASVASVSPSLLEDFRAALNRPDLEVADDLFDAGATSLTMVRLVNKIRQRFGVQVPVDIFLDQPTVAAIAKYVDSQRQTTDAPAAEIDAAPTPAPAPAAVVPLDPVSLSARAHLETSDRRAFGRDPVKFAELSRLLQALAAVRVNGEAKYLYSSAGGLNAVQTYILVKQGRVERLAAGTYYYDADRHALRPVAASSNIDRRAFAERDRDAIDSAAFAIVLVLELNAIAPLYRDASETLGAIEAGYIAQRLLAKRTRGTLRLLPAAGIDFDALAASFALEPTQRFVHCLLGGAGAVAARGTAADVRDPAGASIARSTSGSTRESTVFGTRQALPSVHLPETTDQAVKLWKEQRWHCRRFGDDSRMIQLIRTPVQVDEYRVRSTRRQFDSAPIERRKISGLLRMLSSSVERGGADHLFGSASGLRSLQVYLYAKADRIEGLACGVYRYDAISHALVLVSGDQPANLEQCYTPANRRIFRDAAFCLFLFAPLDDYERALGPDARTTALLDAGYAGQLLLERQAEFGLGLCPIGALRFERVREGFGSQGRLELLHSFMGGGFEQSLPEGWESLQPQSETAAGEPGEQRAGSAEPARIDLAICGIAGRYPGAPDVESFWNNLRQGVDSVSSISEERLRLFGDAATRRSAQSFSSVRYGCVADIDSFDSLLFGIAPADARRMDPQERLLLEVGWECLENAGYTAQHLHQRSSRVGVFVGAMWNDYQDLGVDTWGDGRSIEAGSTHSSLANRLSYVFDFNGPSVALNTSCSGGMTAIHLACESLKRGECDAALVGAVNLVTHPYHIELLRSGQLLSAGAQCRPFSENADGWVVGEGIGAILVKRLEDAERDGDHILAIIKGSAIGHSGKTVRYAAPDAAEQADSIRRAVASAGIGAESITYVEAAAPGAALADSSEVQAIRTVFAPRSVEPLRIGSVKGNIGHLESASALSQVAKVLWQLRSRQIAPTLHAHPVSPLVQVDGDVQIADRLAAWSVDATAPRRALINSIGGTGSAGHVVLEEYVPPSRESSATGDLTLVPLSAASPQQLTEQVSRLLEWSKQHGDESQSLADVAHTLQIGRVPMRERLAFVVRDMAGFRVKLAAVLRGELAGEGVYRGRVGEGSGSARPAAAGTDLHGRAAAWVTGVEVEWNAPARTCRRIPLPTYPFAKVRHWIAARTVVATVEPVAEVPDAWLSTRMERYLQEQIASISEIPLEQIEPTAPLDNYGLSSLMIGSVSRRLNEDVGPVEPTVFFEFRTIRELAAHLVEQHGSRLETLFGRAARVAGPARAALPAPSARAMASVPSDVAEVAIVGLAGRYPGASSIEQFWENLAQGTDCIREVPAERWNHAAYFDERKGTPGKSYSRWGGFIDGVDEFDPLLFGIAPREAELMDPQERQFLQVAWSALEDAGYRREGLEKHIGGAVGVFVGVMSSEYSLIASETQEAVGSSFGLIANRVSYVMDLHGPSLAVDSMCSSSLSALHLAVESIRRGECAGAIAGGVNLSIHPQKYITQAALGMPSDDGHCRSFGDGGSGFVVGEGVGAVLLKPLAKAIEDGDHIYGVIKASALNHGGRTNGYTVPSPQAQAQVIARVLGDGGVPARAVSYVEAHGTGTSLGDPIEIAGLSRAFRQYTPDRQFCAIGSVKSNIGHCESAAGMAGLTKVLLQMKHGQLVPSLHAQVLNSHIDFENTPFVVQQELAPWTRPVLNESEGSTKEYPRIAGLSSFGAGGSNAHLLIQEYVAEETVQTGQSAGSALIVLSAKSDKQLQQQIQQLHEAIEGESVRESELTDVAYTLQVGREAMEHRLGLKVNTLSELKEKLAALLQGRTGIDECYRGELIPNKEALSLFGSDEELQEAVGKWIERGKHTKLLELWVKGLVVDWQRLYAEKKPRRLSLPTYPFAREKFWVRTGLSQASATEAGAARLHPLLHANTSDFAEQRFSTQFGGEEFYLRDHQVGKDRVLPAAAYLEMVRAALASASGLKAEESAAIALLDNVWLRPLVVSTAGMRVHVGLYLEAGGEIEYEVYTEAAEGAKEDTGTEAEEDLRVVYAQGRARVTELPETPKAALVRDMAELQRQCAAGVLSGAQCYERFSAGGLQYGVGHRVLNEVRAGRDAQGRAVAVAQLSLPQELATTYSQYVLHPALVDGALQACIGTSLLAADGGAGITVPYALERVECRGRCPAQAVAIVREVSEAGAPVRKFDIELCDADGVVKVSLGGYSMRELSARDPARGKAATPRAAAPAASEQDKPDPTKAHAEHEELLRSRTLQYLKRVLSSYFKVPVAQIERSAPLEEYGINSIVALQMTRQLENEFGTLSKTLFFEYVSLEGLEGYFITHHRDRLNVMFDVSAEPVRTAAEEKLHSPSKENQDRHSSRSRKARARRNRFRAAELARSGSAESALDVAIIGLNGRYPQARTLDEFWKNLQEGRDSITEIPVERWDHSQYFDPRKGKRGKSYSKWGGFIDGVDEFDPLFFSISPREAEVLDPQERLFLQCVYATLEDAGYTRESLSRYSGLGLPGNVGVFVGVMYEEYPYYGVQLQERGQRIALTGSPSSIANRVSYFCNLHGPSVAVDTMCSSSLTAIHLACESLRHQGCELAIAGGVNVSIHPNKYLMLSQTRFASSDGRCVSFGQGGDGYVPGEGVGSVLLKPLAKAIEDGDHIYGVIKASALNHGGKTNGYTVPSPQAQAQVVARVLAEAGVAARAVSYIEAHGTGTSLGDPIEIAGLSKAFARYTPDRQFCAIGSVKSNIGHCESAAGIAGLTKVLLQMKHGQLVPSLHAQVINPHIDFESTPFVVQRELSPWTRPVLIESEGTKEYPRTAGLSSFGAGGSNAHLLIQEYIVEGSAQAGHSGGPVLIVLSAKSEGQLQQQVQQLHEAIERGSIQESELRGVGYTLQVGREAMEHRLGVKVHTVPELKEKLAALLQGQSEIEECYRGEVKPNKEALSLFGSDEELQEAIGKWIERGKHAKLLELWVKGLVLDWERLYPEEKPRRVSLPTYPYARERYWVPTEITQSATEAGSARLHPLVHANTSDFNEQRFSTLFEGEEFFLSDHQVGGERVLPAAAYLEMVRAALATASGAIDSAAVELKDTVWPRPLVVGGDGVRVHVGLYPQNSGEIEYDVYSEPAEGSDGAQEEARVVYAQGRARVRDPNEAPAAVVRDVAELQQQCTAGVLSGAQCYERFDAVGLRYGAAHRVLHEVRAGRDAQGRALVVAQLSLPEELASTHSQYVLHPALLDGALQACIGIMLVRGPVSATSMGEETWVPYALERLECHGACPAQGVVIGREVSEPGAPLRKFDIELCDTDGTVKVSLRGYSMRKLDVPSRGDQTLLMRREWQAQVAQPQPGVQYSQHHVLLCEVGEPPAGVPAVQWEVLRSTAGSVGARYVQYAQALLQSLQKILRSKPTGVVRVQVVVPSHGDGARYAGLVAALKTAQQENPQLHGQLIAVESGETPQSLWQKVQQNAADEAVDVRYEMGQRRIAQIKEYTPEGPASGKDKVFKSGGVYLISGGAGGLGQVFAREIFRQAPDARVILTGRRQLSTEQLLPELQQWAAAGGGVLQYRSLDVTDSAAVRHLIRDLVSEHGGVDGVIHSAGVLRDSFLIRKSVAEIDEVLAPKVYGAQNLDEATADQKLDFFVLFSSLSGLYGNVGQADYAVANAYLDEYARYRAERVRRGERQGRTVSINWPLWDEGGMKMPDAARAQMHAAGYVPLKQAQGVSAFARALSSDAEQVLVLSVQGDRARALRQTDGASEIESADAPSSQAASNELLADFTVSGEAGASWEQRLQERTCHYLKRLVSRELKVPAERIDVQASLEDYGIDSVRVLQLTRELEQEFGVLSKTLFFEYQTLEALAQYFVAHHASQLKVLLKLDEPRESVQADVAAGAKSRGVTKSPASRRSGRRQRLASVEAPEPVKPSGDIAIIGLSGRYPQARTLDEFWKNLQEGRDSVTEIPLERWDHSQYFDPQKGTRGKSYSKWGAFIEGVDEFDPLFFNISPREAQVLDPQERLFLQCVYTTLEDAGYTRESLGRYCSAGLPGNVGVFVGVMYEEYQLFGAQAQVLGQPVVLGGSPSSIANRASYFCNLHGPSVAVDTMCSSSLTAIHLACESLRHDDCELAIAGGVNVSIHPNKYLALSAGQFASSGGRCESFGEGGDGYVPGEGVGAVLLKSLAKAIEDGDHIYGVIKASALNHGGKTNGYTVPNPNAQAQVIANVLAEGGVPARAVSYIEAHGTGTSLGDPIEIAGLSKAFGQHTPDRQFCAIGSVKSNIGHCESAAGIAGLTKVLLQMKHGQLVPSLHAQVLNPHIDFESTPFVVQRELSPWMRPILNDSDGGTKEYPRIAGLSSFGAGGSNAHLLIQEYVADEPAQTGLLTGPLLVVLSAKSEEQLQQQVRQLHEAIERGSIRESELGDVAYTLQVGREAMEHRLGLKVGTLSELQEKLTALLQGQSGIEECYRGEVKPNKEALSVFAADEDLQRAIEAWVAKGKYEKLLELWVKGLVFDWQRLYADKKPRRRSLPTYPFARERYWVPNGVQGDPAEGGARLHPLVHTNTSDFAEQRFSTQFGGEEFYLRDHLIGGARVLPAAAYLEMVRAALASASGLQAEDCAAVELRDAVWQRPLVVGAEAVRVHVGLYPQDSGEIEYEVYADAAEGSERETAEGSESEPAEASRVVYAQGRARVRELEEAPKAIVHDVAELKRQCTAGVFSGAQCYEKFDSAGMQYGLGHRVLREVRAGRDAQGRALVVAQLSLPQELSSTHAQYVLHPALLDGALQACIGVTLLGEDGKSGITVPYALERLECHGPIPAQAVAIVREVSEPGAPLRKFDIELCDADGTMKVSLRGYSMRKLEMPSSADQTRLLTRQWQAQDAQPQAAVEYSQHHVLLCEVGEPPAGVPAVQWEVLRSTAGSVGARYVQYAQSLLQSLQKILLSRPSGAVRVQVVVPSHGEGARYAGLVAALKTAQQENPQLHGQLIAVESGETPDSLWQKVQQNAADEAVEVRYEKGQRRVAYIKEYPPAGTAGAGEPGSDKHGVFKSGGVYLISGGAGGLGQVFAREILRQAPDAQVILTGRRQPSTEQLPPELRQLAIAGGGSLQYRSLDVTDAAAVRDLVGELVSEHGRVDGVIHSAGVLRDSFLIRKSATEVDEVLAPKVYGAQNLDEATADQKLDFFVLFSSLAGVYGNAGQADYAVANAYLDEYARYRDELVKRGEREGRTVSINWPLWDEGGMRMPEAARAQMHAAGYVPLKQAQGVRAFARALSAESVQVLVLSVLASGRAPAVLGRTALEDADAPSSQAGHTELPADLTAPREVDAPREHRLQERTCRYLTRLVGRALKISVERIDVQASLEQYGIDSVVMTLLTKELEREFGPLSQTLFFEYQSLEALAQYFVSNHREKLSAFLDIPRAAGPEAAPTQQNAAKGGRKARTRKAARVSVPDWEAIAAANAAATSAHGKIAIVGISGRFPQARTLEQFWKNLSSGRDCVTEVPVNRWDHAQYFDPRKGVLGKSYSKWGAFIDGVDEFDPLFFNISPREAQLLDPQERLFLETVWNLLEERGITRERLRTQYGRRIGVYVGSMYQMYGAIDADLTQQAATTLSTASAIANRVSYFFGLQGPSMGVDTMCSSSLTAIHMACADLLRGDCRVAIAGGVNLWVHPKKYVGLSQVQVLASDPTNRSFEQGDGYVPAEAVGAVLLKPLSVAIEDGDEILGVIRATAVNHGGRSNGYFVPNLNAQADVIVDCLSRAQVDAASVSYVEAAAVGSSLSDPVEIAALTRAFSASGTTERQYCVLGSVKSALGHAEAASTMTQLAKVLLQLRHRQIVPSVNVERLNPAISLQATPFRFQEALGEWVPSAAAGHPRRALINSFGAGGSNATLLLEEYVEPARVEASAANTAPTARRELIVLSARTPERLVAQVLQMQEFLQQAAPMSLSDMAYTLQTGREPMDSRLAVVVSDRQELLTALTAYVQAVESGHAPETACALYQRASVAAGPAISALARGAAGAAVLEALLASEDLEGLALFWTEGGQVPWERLHPTGTRRFVCLPTYAFARVRHWITPTQAIVEAPHADPDPPAIQGGSADHDTIASFIESFVAQALELAGERIGWQTDLQQYGATSFTYTRLIRALKRQFHVEVSGRDLLEHRTVDSLAAHLAARLGEQEVATTTGQHEPNGNAHTDVAEFLERFRTGELDIETLESLIDSGTIQ